MKLSRMGQRLSQVVGIGLAALLVSGSALADVKNTKHNLGTTGGSANQNSGTDQVCVFCHTPHGSNTGMSSAPLWNRATPTNTYKLYNSTNPTATLDGEVIAPDTGSVSMACLSCHDGTQALNSLQNDPGSGSTNSTFTAGTWTSTSGSLDTATGKFKTSSIVNLAGSTAGQTDLSNDHPIGIPYCGGLSSGTSGTCADDGFVPLTASGGKYWVDTDSTPATRSKVDLPLYVRTFASSTARPSVECGSCHDPHAEAKTGAQGGGVAEVNFMRVALKGSAICLSCHVK